MRARTNPATTRNVSAGLLRCVIAFGILPAALALGGCDRVAGIFADRAEAKARKEARTAIDAYSTASQRANGAHAKVIEAFAKANTSRNLSEYKTAMRDQVLVRMSGFIELLEFMPAGTPELKRIHGILISAYKAAHADITKFVKELESPRDLGKFTTIREQLQAQVQDYRAQLDVYYGNFSRKLRGGEPKPAVSTPAMATATSP